MEFTERSYGVRFLKLAGLVSLMTLVIVVVYGCQQTQQTAQPSSSMMQPGQQQAPANLGPDTVVPEGMKLEDYVDKYYLAYKEQRWSDAYHLLPAGRKAQETLEKYQATLEGMPLQDYKVNPAKIKGSQATVQVEVVLGGSGAGYKIVVSWAFVKKDDKWVAQATTTMMQ